MDSARRRRVDDICEGALELAASDRPAFVAAACGDDSALRTEVEALLSHAGQSDGFLEESLGEIAAEVIDHREELAAGRRLGQYEIVGLIGAGGMGEVYRARDTKLGRDVAIKVISSAAPADADQMARFEREARILAALNHPHIGAIYGLEDVDGIRALVLELVEGKTLAERLAEARPSMPAALTIAREIAAALEAAHEKGVIHRDLKPANIKITPDGAVKVLDFGLAKVFASDDPAVDSSRLPRVTFEDREGVIAGTAGYMSPEQARGTAVTKRADIWAFGCVLYEMVAGRPAFSGDTSAEITAWILERDPDWSALPAGTPATVQRLLRRCLERDAARRLRDIGDARLEIDDALSGAPLPVNVPAAVARRRRPVLWWAVAAAILIGGAGAAITYLPRAERPAQPEVAEIVWRDPFEDATYQLLTDFNGGEHHAAISRDGKFVVFIADRQASGVWDAWVAQLGATPNFINLTKGRQPELRNPATKTVGFMPEAEQVVLWGRTTDSGVVDTGMTVPTMGGEIQPFQKRQEPISELDFSSDGKRLVYHPPTGGDPVYVIADREQGAAPGLLLLAGEPGWHNHFPIWSPDDAFIYVVRGLPLDKSDVWRIPSSGGAPERITFHDSAVTFPTLLDDRTLLYLATDDDGYGPWIYAMDLDSPFRPGDRRPWHRISRGFDKYTSLAASKDGRLLVATLLRSTQSSVWRLRIADRPVNQSRVSRVALQTASGASPKFGREFFTYHAPLAGRDVIWKARVGGESIPLSNRSEGRVASGAVVTRDGKRLAFVVHRGGQRRLWVMNADGSDPRPISGDLEVHGAPAWSPDGRWVAAGVYRGNEVHLYKFPADGGPAIPLISSKSGTDRVYATDPAWSPSGDFLVYTGPDVGTNFDLFAVNADGTPHTVPKLTLTRGARRLAFRGEHDLVFMDGNISYRDFFLLDLRNGKKRKLSDLKFAIQDFDISTDGSEIIFDRLQEESDIVLIQRPVR